MQPLRTLVMVAVIVCVASATCEARPVRYAFEVTANDGPLEGQRSIGTFAFESSLITQDYSVQDAPGLFSAFSFTWAGTLFDETTANTERP